MNVYLSNNLLNSILSVKNKATFEFNNFQKKILLVAVAVFSSLVVLYYLSKKIFYFKAKKTEKREPKKKEIIFDLSLVVPKGEKVISSLPQDLLGFGIGKFLSFKEMSNFLTVDKTCFTKMTPIVNEEKASRKAVEEAINLMFADRTLYHHAIFLTFTEQQLVQRHENIIQAIAKIKQKHLRMTIGYREGMIGRSTNLLIQAITQIKNKERRLEIVKLLLERGVDPHQKAFHYVEVIPLDEAKKTKDPELIALLEKALQTNKS